MKHLFSLYFFLIKIEKYKSFQSFMLHAPFAMKVAPMVLEGWNIPTTSHSRNGGSIPPLTFLQSCQQ